MSNKFVSTKSKEMENFLAIYNPTAYDEVFSTTDLQVEKQNNNNKVTRVIFFFLYNIFNIL